MRSMLRAILVDDDYPVLRYLSDTVNWKGLDIELIGSYSNGQEAWEAVYESQPDLIITDIGMPKMNGLDLLKQVLTLKYPFKAVILSCHNDFAYAQQAMKMNVCEYILKESLEVEDLEKILRKAAEELNEGRQQAQQVELFKQKEKRNLGAVKEKFLDDTLYQSSWTKEAWLKQAAANGLELDARYYIPVAVVIDRVEQITKRRMLNEYTIAFSVENVLQDMLIDAKAVLFKHSNKELVLLFGCTEPVQEKQEIYFSMLRAKETIERLLKVTVTCLIGREVPGPKELRQVLVPMLEHTEQRFYSRENNVDYFKEVVFSENDLFQHYAEMFAAMNNSIALHDFAQLRSLIVEWMNRIRQACYHPSHVREFFMQLLLDLQMKLKLTLHYQDELSKEKLYDAVLAIESIDQLEEWLLQIFEALMERLSVVSMSSARSEIIKAQQYVISRVTEKITLEEIAEYLNLNASYFSRLFKRETDQNFIEYVNKVKLMKAKELLQQSNKTVEEISDYLGYSNKSYFIKLFKREIGMKPSEYAAWRQHV